MYYRYVDDTFCLFKCKKDADLFLVQLNPMHPSLKFTEERESNERLPFLDVFMHKTPTAFLSSVYRKPTFSGLYTWWDSFYPQQRKINLIKTLVHRALLISSKCFIVMKSSSSSQLCLRMGIHYPFWMVLSMMLWLSLTGLAGAL